MREVLFSISYTVHSFNSRPFLILEKQVGGNGFFVSHLQDAVFSSNCTVLVVVCES